MTLLFFSFKSSQFFQITLSAKDKIADRAINVCFIVFSSISVHKALSDNPRISVLDTDKEDRLNRRYEKPFFNTKKSFKVAIHNR